MQCRKCGSENLQAISNTYGSVKRRGCLMTLIHIFLVICTAGLWLIVPLIRGGSKGKIRTKVQWVCNSCGAKQ
jgi:hypothetical protein